MPITNMIYLMIFGISICSSEFIPYNYDNFDEIIGDSEFQLKRWSEIPAEFNVDEPTEGPETGGIFFLGVTDHSYTEKILIENKPDNISVTISYWCGSDDSRIEIKTCLYSAVNLCEGRGWFVEHVNDKCDEYVPVPFGVTISGNSVNLNEAAGIQYLEVYTDGSTKPTETTTIATTTSEVTTTPGETTTDEVTTSPPATTSEVTTTPGETTTAEVTTTTPPVTTSEVTTTPVETTTVEVTTTTNTPPATTSEVTTTPGETTTVEVTTTTPPTTLTPEKTTVITTTPTPDATTSTEVSETTESPNTEECDNLACILGLTDSQFLVVLIACLLCILILIIMLLFICFKRNRRIYVEFEEYGRFVHWGKSSPSSQTLSPSTAVRRRSLGGGYANRGDPFNIPRVNSYRY